jgi:hypothetical protein
VQVICLRRIYPEILEESLLDIEHRAVVRVDRIEFFPGQSPGVGNAIDVNVVEGHENSDDDAFAIEFRFAHGVPQ